MINLSGLRQLESRQWQNYFWNSLVVITNGQSSNSFWWVTSTSCVRNCRRMNSRWSLFGPGSCLMLSLPEDILPFFPPSIGRCQGKLLFGRKCSRITHMYFPHLSQLHMMTSSNENIFRFTGHLCGELNFPHNGLWRGALMFSLICAWINGWVNNRQAGNLRRRRAHYDVTVMHM